MKEERRILDKCEYCMDYVYEDQKYSITPYQDLVKSPNTVGMFTVMTRWAVWHTKCVDIKKPLKELLESDN